MLHCGKQIHSATLKATVLVSGGQQWGEASHCKSLELQVLSTGVPLFSVLLHCSNTCCAAGKSCLPSGAFFLLEALTAPPSSTFSPQVQQEGHQPPTVLGKQAWKDKVELGNCYWARTLHSPWECGCCCPECQGEGKKPPPTNCLQ